MGALDDRGGERPARPGAGRRLLGPALAEVGETGLVRALQSGAKSLARGLEARGGAAAPPPGDTAGPQAPPETPRAAAPNSGFPYAARKFGQTEPGAVPPTPELQAQIDADPSVPGRSAPGFPDLPQSQAKNFGDDVRPWNGDEHDGPIKRVIGSDESANGGYWQSDIPATEGEWRGGSAVLNDWNGDGGYVESPSSGLRGWIGSARPQLSSDGSSILPGGGQQIWLPPGSATPSAPQPTPWISR